MALKLTSMTALAYQTGRSMGETLQAILEIAAAKDTTANANGIVEGRDQSIDCVNFDIIEDIYIGFKYFCKIDTYDF